MKYTLNITLSEREAVTIAAAMAAAAFDDGILYKTKKDTSGFRKIYTSLYKQLSQSNKDALDSVMSIYQEVMGNPTFSRGVMHGALESMKQDFTEGIKRVKKEKGGSDAE